MADATFITKVYEKDGGDTVVVASGGLIDIETGGDLKYNGNSLIDEIAALSGLNSTELGFINGAASGAATASKAAVYDAAGKLYRSSATPAAAGTAITDATVLTAEFNAVTGANGGAGVKLPVAGRTRRSPSSTRMRATICWSTRSPHRRSMRSVPAIRLRSRQVKRPRSSVDRRRFGMLRLLPTRLPASRLLRRN